MKIFDVVERKFPPPETNPAGLEEVRQTLMAAMAFISRKKSDGEQAFHLQCEQHFAYAALFAEIKKFIDELEKLDPQHPQLAGFKEILDQWINPS